MGRRINQCSLDTAAWKWHGTGAGIHTAANESHFYWIMAGSLMSSVSEDCSASMCASNKASLHLSVLHAFAKS